MSKINSPKIEITYLADIELSYSANTLSHELGRPSDVFSDKITVDGAEVQKYGKKGFFLSGGSVNENTQEVSGCIMDGSYQFFDSKEKYPGILGNVLSGDDYTFASEQSITVSPKYTGSVIRDIVLVFDEVAGEYATHSRFSSEPNTTYRNNRLTFIKVFSSDISDSVKVIFDKWSKKNSLAKLKQIKTGITGEYDYRTIKSMDFSNEKISNEEEVSFSVTSQYCDISLIDKDGVIQSLHEASLIHDNIVAQIYLVDTAASGLETKTKIGEFVLQSYENEKGSSVWNFTLVDKLEKFKDIVVEPHEVEKMTIYEVVNYALERIGFGSSISWGSSAEAHCKSVVIPNAWIEPNQYAFDVLCKCCEVGLLRIFIQPTGEVRIERGL